MKLPKMLLASQNVTIFVRFVKADKISCCVGNLFLPTHTNLPFVCCANLNQGNILDVCSKYVKTNSSSFLIIFFNPFEIKLRDSVAPEVKIISSELQFSSLATLLRLSSISLCVCHANIESLL